jgi:NAD(P)-dependent dehydrogenase (short-subunit alcohol dehydrogenase family)
MAVVVVTGSTRGIGLALARKFIALGHCVVASGRTAEAADRAVRELRGSDSRALAVACDVRQLTQVQSLWDAAAGRFGRIDIWINNAGQAHETHRFWEQPAERIEAVIATNLCGVMHGCHVAMRGMLGQGGGALYNLTGFGRTNLFQPGMAIYGTSKRGVDYFTRALAREAKGRGVIVGQINPGMVVTDMLREGATSSVRNRASILRYYELMGCAPDEAADFIVPRVLANRRSGVLINRQPRYVVLGKLLAAPFRRGSLADAR